MGDIVRELDPLFNPRSVAVIGATNSWNKWGYSTFSSIIQSFEGKVYPVNLKEDKILGRKAYKKVGDIPDDVDLVIFVIPAEIVPGVMEECSAKGVKAAVIITAGFRETGKDGRDLENEVIRAAKKGGIRFVGPNCMGIWSASSKLKAYMFPFPTIDGPIAFVSQGGNVGGAVVMSAFKRGIGFHRYVSCGPAADIQIEDYIEYFGDDPDVKVILTYIEGLSDGKRFIEKVSKVTRKKPVIALKPGRTEAAAHAILSHSGAIAGSNVIYNEAFKKSGVLRTESPEELLDLAVGFLTQPLPSGRNVAIVTGGGSYGVICSEYCETLGLRVIDLPEETIEAFSKIFPPRWSHGNPVDPAGDRNFIAYYAAPQMLLELDQVDSLIFMGFGSISGFTSMISSSGGDHIFFQPSTDLFSSITGIDEIIAEVLIAIKAGDIDKLNSFMKPMMPIISSVMGTNPDTMDKFVSMIMDEQITRDVFAELIKIFPGFLIDGTVGIEILLEKFDKLVSSLLFSFMKKYKKPIISTTFSESAPILEGAAHPFPTAEKAAMVLSKMVEYREYLERVDSFEDPLKYCTILNYEFN